MLLVLYQHLHLKEQPPVWTKVLNVVLIGGGLAVYFYLFFNAVFLQVGVLITGIQKFISALRALGTSPEISIKKQIFFWQKAN